MWKKIRDWYSYGINFFYYNIFTDFQKLFVIVPLNLFKKCHNNFDDLTKFYGN